MASSIQSDTSLGLSKEENVMLVYIRVSVVLSQSLCRKEREKLYITLDRHSFSFGSLGNLVNLYFFKPY
jgi:hypothetical protein